MTDLAMIPIGKPVVMTDLNKIEDRLRRRLLALGFYEGCPVVVRRRASFQGPLTIEQRDHHQMIAIRKSDAKNIGVFLP
ncbi:MULTISPECIES: FeoA family protein [Exiguobacterium]|uniref:FeoA family protein n=1 Tax=Exiguobacterium TaxID=33986 RepID=UPI00047ADF28|nr:MULTISPECIES: FeoA family protein [Exiguobacterium]MCK2157993.1 ferrous iron transport protein A [Exiguobacterium sp. 17-1]MDW2886600.1 FeoA family protein [Exiguobacterium sibiricum]MDX1259835.1 ferrous iron transport protein A [Exiguobacterium sp. K1]RDB34773.1 ferrous iron transport protein A [Exiguobacterium sp. RIT594]HCN58877.1 ferrous iron transport protein A [Exiguobacterium sp.]